MKEPEVEKMNAEIEAEGGPVAVDQARVMTALAKLPDRALLDEAALADALRVSDRTIRRMVDRGELPPGTKLAGRKAWLAGRVLDWIESRAERLEKEAEKSFSKISQINP